ncbi:MAG: hypothetical protein Q4F69_02475 [Bacteroidia bacterium]|nr:hypothetical protein [Bacteroidia bacterium]
MILTCGIRAYVTCQYHYRSIRRICSAETDADENATQHFCQVAKNKKE